MHLSQDICLTLSEWFPKLYPVFETLAGPFWKLQADLCRRRCRGVTDHSDVFLSYSRHDGEAAINLRGQLQRRGLNVFKDDERIRVGELWLDRLQEAVGLRALVVLVAHFGGYD